MHENKANKHNKQSKFIVKNREEVAKILGQNQEFCSPNLIPQPYTSKDLEDPRNHFLQMKKTKNDTNLLTP